MFKLNCRGNEQKGNQQQLYLYPIYSSSSSSISFRSVCEALPSDPVVLQPLNLAPCFAVFSCFLQNGPFSGFPQSSSPSGSLRIPIRCLFFNIFTPLPQNMTDPSPFSRFDL